jgi:hypothetical protein
MKLRPQKNSFSKLFRHIESTDSLPVVENTKKESKTKSHINKSKSYWHYIVFFATALALTIIIISGAGNLKYVDKSGINNRKKEPTIFSSSTINRPIIHIQTDDRSDSAINNQDLQHLHCQISRDNYQVNDVRAVVDFASQPETVSQMFIKKSSLPNICDRQIKTKQIDTRPGTSLILALEHILNLVESLRDRGQLNNVLVTLTIHEAESGPEQPLMNEEGLNRLKKTVKALEHQKTIIVIAGVRGNLKKQLIEYFNLGPYQRFCQSSELSECISKSFRAARNWDY